MKLSVIWRYEYPSRYAFVALSAYMEQKLGEDIDVFYAPAEELPSLTSSLPGLKLIGFSFYSHEKEKIKKEVERIKKTEDIILIAGGPHPSGDPYGTLRMGFDYVFFGEGEVSFVSFLRRIMKGERPEERIIKGEKIGLDFFPFPRKKRRFSPIEITRGCPSGCFFCQTSYLFGKKFRHRPVEVVKEAVKFALDAGLKDMRFISPNSFAYGSEGKTPEPDAIYSLLSSIHELVHPRGRIFFGSFPSEVGPEWVTPELVSMVKKFCSNDNLVIGAQSGSERILKAIHRSHGVPEIYRAAECVLSQGLRAYVDIIFGLPGETEEDMYETFKLMENLIKMGARIHAHYFMPLPGTPFARKKPASLPSSLLKDIRRLVSKGKVFGDWEKQMHYSSLTEA